MRLRDDPGPPWAPRFAEASPLFAPLREGAACFEQLADWPSVEAIDAALAHRAGVRFELQPPRPKRRRRRDALDVGSLYDARIHEAGVVPTRARSWHDLLNALVFAAFPRAKAALHARQHAAIAARIQPAARTLPPRRTRELDALALLDEGGLLLLATSTAAHELAAAVASSDVARVAGAIRGGHAAALLFGHAVYEHLVFAAPTVRATTWLAPAVDAIPIDVDAQARLADARLAEALAVGAIHEPRALASLPVSELLAPRVDA